MATRADVRRIALSLPDTEQGDGHFAFSVRNKGKLKGFAWVWMERVEVKKPRVPNPGVLAVRVANLAEKDLLISVEPTKFFTERALGNLRCALAICAVGGGQDRIALLPLVSREESI